MRQDSIGRSLTRIAKGTTWIALAAFTGSARDAHAQQTYERVSVRSYGGQLAKGAYQDFALSGDARFVAFVAEDDDVTKSGVKHASIFVRDRVMQKTQRVSVAAGGGPANGESWSPSISRDGRFVAFVSSGANFGTADTDIFPDIYLRDRGLGTTTLVTDTTMLWSDPGLPRISADGTHVVFTDSQTDTPCTYAFEIATASIVGNTGAFMTTSGVSADGAVAIGTAWPVYIAEIGWPLLSQRTDLSDSAGLYYLFPSKPVIAADASAVFLAGERVPRVYPYYGRWTSTYWYAGSGSGLAFWRTWTKMTYRVDLVTLDATIVPIDGAVPQSTSADGRYLTYAGNVGGQTGLHRYDLELGRPTTVVADPFPWSASALSDDGRTVLFLSYQTGLVPGDTNGMWDLFVTELPEDPHQRK